MQTVASGTRPRPHNYVPLLRSALVSPSFFLSLCLSLWFLEPTVCGNTGKVCHNMCVIDLTSQTPSFHCALPASEGDARAVPAISRTVPSSTLPKPLFAGILSLVGKNSHKTEKKLQSASRLVAAGSDKQNKNLALN